VRTILFGYPLRIIKLAAITHELPRTRLKHKRKPIYLSESWDTQKGARGAVSDEPSRWVPEWGFLLIGATSAKRPIQLPGLYACLLCLLISALGIRIPAPTLSTLKSAYVVLGMMMLGLVLSQRRLSLNLPFICGELFIRFGAWFGATWILLAIDWATLGALAPPISQSILWMMGFRPIGANLIAYAVDAEASPEQIAPAVVLSTLLSPLLLAWAF
jgi:predicted permease